MILRGTVASPLQPSEVLRAACRESGQVDDVLHLQPLGIDTRADADGDRGTLSGLVDLETDRDRAERVALSADDITERVTDAIAPGVVDVYDEITVRAHP